MMKDHKDENDEHDENLHRHVEAIFFLSSFYLGTAISE